MRPETDIQNPFVGPRPFDRKDRRLFFGRDRESGDLLSLTIAHSLLLFYAQSGAGKTSLLNTRLIPMLEEEGFEVITGRVAGPVPKEVDQRQIKNLYAYNVLLSCAGPAARPQSFVDKSIADFLREKQRDSASRDSPKARALILDQFEELFTVHPPEAEQREGFLDQIRAALEDDSLLRVLVALREEYVPQLDPYSRLLPEWPLSSYRMERLRRPAALQAVTGPLALAGRSFAPGVDEALVDDLLRVRVYQVTGERSEVVEVAGEFVEPVQLQIVCERLWSTLPSGVEIITHEHLRVSGRADSALAEFYDRAVAVAHHETQVSERAIRQWCGESLVTQLRMRGRIPRGERETAGLPNSAVDVLERQHLIRAEPWSGAPWYELTHDRLVEPVLASNQRDSERRQRLRGAIIMVLAILALLAAPAVVRFWAEQIAQQEAEAAHQARVAQSRQFAARVPSALARDPELGLLLAMQAISVTYSIDSSYTVEAYGALWQALDSPPYAILAGHTSRVNWATFDPGGQKIVTASADGTARLWDIHGAPLATLTGHTGAVLRAAFSPDGERVVTASVDSTARLWAADGQPIAELLGHDGPVNDALFSPDGRLIVTASADGTARLWDVEGNCVAVLSGHTGAVNNSLFSPDGQLILTSSTDGTARLWRLDGTPVTVMTGHTASVNHAEFSPDGQLIVTASVDRKARVWDLSGQNTATLSGHMGSVTHASFSPDGQRIVTASTDGTARVWDRDGRPVVILGEHLGPVHCAVFSPDGFLIATASADGKVRLWHREGQALGALSDGSDEALHAEFSPDSQLVVTAKLGGAVRLHHISVADMMALAQSRVTRTLTPEELQTYGGDTLLVPTPEPTPPPSPTTLAPPETPAPTPTPPSPPGMVLIPAGDFHMGSSQTQMDYALRLCEQYSSYDRYPCYQVAFEDEYPPRSVYLDEFFIDVHEVTNDQYLECVQAGVCTPPKETWSPTRDGYFGEPAYDDYPVTWVSWYDAQTYCEWAGKRLPTEAEWEKAARSTDGRIWPWGDEWREDRLNCCGSAGDMTRVGSYPSGASPYGVQDMAGNAWEWVADCYEYLYYASGPDSNPKGPTCPADPDAPAFRVLRGGSWSYPPRYARATDRSPNDPDNRYPNIGFRCAM